MGFGPVQSYRDQPSEKGIILGIVVFLIVGFVVGLVARAVVPGKDSMGILATIVLGVVGSFVGGLLAVVFTDRVLGELTPAQFIGSLIGAVIALLIYRRMGSR